jgi:hypothetical protein
MLGADACLASLVVFKHLRSAVNRGLRTRAGLTIERAHEEHVHDSKARGKDCLKGDANDIVRCEGQSCHSSAFWWSDEVVKFAAGNLTASG